MINVAINPVASTPTAVSVGESYLNKIQRILGANILILQPLDELVGSVAVNQSVGILADGTYTSVTLNDTLHPSGTPSPLFDGINSYITNDAAGLNGNFDFDEYTAMVWIKVPAWSGSHYIGQGLKDATTANRFQLWQGGTYEYGAVRSGTANIDSVSPVSADGQWKCYLVTSSIIADEIRFYENGLPSGAVITGLNAAGGTTWTDHFLGKFSSFAGAHFSGNMAYYALANVVVTPAVALDLSTV